MLAPTSVHQSGGVYEWDIALDEMPRPAPPEWLLAPEPNQHKSNKKRERAPARSRIPEGVRHTTLISMAGDLWRAGLDHTTLEAALLDHNRRYSEKPDEMEDKVREIALWVSETGDPPPWALNGFRFAMRAGEKLGLSASARMVLAALVSGARDDGRVTRGRRRICAESGLSPATVVRALRELEDVRAVKIVKRDKRFGTTFVVSRCGLWLW